MTSSYRTAAPPPRRIHPEFLASSRKYVRTNLIFASIPALFALWWCVPNVLALRAEAELGAICQQASSTALVRYSSSGFVSFRGVQADVEYVDHRGALQSVHAFAQPMTDGEVLRDLGSEPAVCFDPAEPSRALVMPFAEARGTRWFAIAFNGFFSLVISAIGLGAALLEVLGRKRRLQALMHGELVDATVVGIVSPPVKLPINFDEVRFRVAGGRKDFKTRISGTDRSLRPGTTSGSVLAVYDRNVDEAVVLRFDGYPLNERIDEKDVAADPSPRASAPFASATAPKPVARFAPTAAYDDDLPDHARSTSTFALLGSSSKNLARGALSVAFAIGLGVVYPIHLALEIRDDANAPDRGTLVETPLEWRTKSAFGLMVSSTTTVHLPSDAPGSQGHFISIWTIVSPDFDTPAAAQVWVMPDGEVVSALAVQHPFLRGFMVIVSFLVAGMLARAYGLSAWRQLVDLRGVIDLARDGELHTVALLPGGRLAPTDAARLRGKSLDVGGKAIMTVEQGRRAVVLVDPEGSGWCFVRFDGYPLSLDRTERTALRDALESRAQSRPAA